MSLDINRKQVTKNAYRVTKVRDLTALRVRVPGGKITGEMMIEVANIANEYGNGRVHLTTRQGFEILGIPWENMDACNKAIQVLIDNFNINQPNGVDAGYPAAGTRNIVACIGNEVCFKAQYNTTKLAQRIEKAIFPNDLHFKVAVTGCMNDCQKVRLHDFGVMGMALPELDKNRCISCGQCEKKCTRLSTSAITMIKNKPYRDHATCIGCGECVLICPAGAWTRNENKFYRLAIMGRTGKKNPRLAQDWMVWVDEETIVKVITNTYEYVTKYIDTTLPKEHIGYIVDRTGFNEFRDFALKDTNIPKQAIIHKNINWNGIKY